LNSKPQSCCVEFNSIKDFILELHPIISMNQHSQSPKRSPGNAGKAIVIDDLMRNYYTYIYRLALSILNDPDEAEDAAQETFIRVAAHLAEFRGDAEIKTWLSAIAINICRGELRKRRGRTLLEKVLQSIQTVVGKAPDPEDQAAQNDLHAQLRQAIAGLDEKHRFPVILYYLQHLSACQIAAIMKTNENTIHARLYHARRKLATKLKGAYPEAPSTSREDDTKGER
jgi:RNA polymerase sigma-70 factor (ECF subfamily)